MSSKARKLDASRVINAPARKIFAFLARPDNHVLLDTSGMIRGSADHATMTEMGAVFAMNRHNEMNGDHRTKTTLSSTSRTGRSAGHQPSRVTSRRGTRGSGDLRP
jgi:hypothetical protein